MPFANFKAPAGSLSNEQKKKIVHRATDLYAEIHGERARALAERAPTISHTGVPADADRQGEYDQGTTSGLSDDVLKKLAAEEPADADPSTVARAVVEVVDAPFGARIPRALSSVYEFVSTLDWQTMRFSVEIRHISNGAMHEPNCGETMLLLGVRLH